MFVFNILQIKIWKIFYYFNAESEKVTFVMNCSNVPVYNFTIKFAVFCKQGSFFWRIVSSLLKTKVLNM